MFPLNYQIISTAHKPTSVYSSCKGNFLSENEISLIVAKCNRLETYAVINNELKLMGEQVVYGRIINIQTISLKGLQRDSIIILSQKRQFAIWHWNGDKCYLEVQFAGSVLSKVERPLDSGSMMAVDPYGRCVAILAFQGVVHIVSTLADTAEPIGNAASFNPHKKMKSSSANNFFEPSQVNNGDISYTIPKINWNHGKGKEIVSSMGLSKIVMCRIEELKVLDLKFLDDPKFLTLAVLYEDASMIKHIKTYRIQVTRPYNHSRNVKIRLEMNWQYRDVGYSSNMMASRPSGGLLVVGDSNVVLLTYSGALEKVPNKKLSSIKLGNSPINAIELIQEADKTPNRQHLDNQSQIGCIPIPKPSPNLKSEITTERLLLGDDNGVLWLVVLFCNANGSVSKCSIERLGEIPIPQTLSYVGKGSLYVGSHYGDSRLIALHQNPNALNRDIWNKLSPKQQGKSFLETLQTFNNLAPISDMCVVKDVLNPSSNYTSGGGMTSNPSNQSHITSLNEAKENNGGERLITCSGLRSKASLRVVRSGLGIKPRGTVDLKTVCGVWSVAAADQNSQTKGDFRILLILAFPTCTSILELSVNEKTPQCKIELTQPGATFIQNGGWDLSEPTIFAGNTRSLDMVIQVTSRNISLLRYSTCLAEDTWQPMQGEDIMIKPRITSASGYKNHLVVSLENGQLIYFKVSANEKNPKSFKLIKTNEINLQAQVSSLVLRDPFCSDQKQSSGPLSKCPIVAVACWTKPNLRIFNLPDLETVFETSITTSDSHFSSSRSMSLNSPNLDYTFSRECNIDSKPDTNIRSDDKKSSCHANNSSSIDLPASNVYKGLGFTPGSLIRDVELVRFDDQPFMLIGLSNGHLLSYMISISSPATENTNKQNIEISSEKNMSLGSYPVSLVSYQVDTKQYVFIATDKPAVMYSHGSKPLFSHVNADAVLDFCPIVPEILQKNENMASILGNTMCFINQNSLSLATIEKVQKMHIDTIPLPPWESPYKLAHYKKDRLLALCSIELLPQNVDTGLNRLDGLADPIAEKGWVTIMDDSSFEVLAKIGLPSYELPESVTCLSLQMISRKNVSQAESGSLGHESSELLANERTASEGLALPSIDVIAVGTAITLPDDDDASSGNIYLFRYDRSKKKLVELQKIPTKGAVYSLVSFKGMLAASINNNVVLYAWKQPQSFTNKIKVGNYSSKTDQLGDFYPVELEILSVESTHVVSLHLAVASNTNSHNQNPKNQEFVLEESSNDFLAVGDLMTGVSVIQHKLSAVTPNSKFRNSDHSSKMGSISQNESPTGITNIPKHQNAGANDNSNSGFIKDPKKPETLVHHRLEEVSREYFSSWTTALSCLKQPRLPNTPVKPKNDLFGFNLGEEQDKRFDKVGLQFLVGENGLNLYSLYYGEDLLHESKVGDSSSSTSNNALDKNSQAVKTKSRDSEPQDSAEKQLQLTGRYHLGDLVNVIIPGTLVMRNFKSESGYFTPDLLFGTLSGAIYASINVNEGKVGRILDRLQTNMAVLGPASLCGYTVYSGKYANLNDFYTGYGERVDSTPGLADPISRFLSSAMFSWSHTKFRTYSNLQKTCRQFGFIDGDLVMAYLDFPKDLQAFIFNGGSNNIQTASKARIGSEPGTDEQLDHLGKYDNQLFVSNAFDIPEEKLSTYGISSVSDIGASEDITLEYLVQCLESLSMIV